MKVLLVSNNFHIENGGSFTAISELAYALNAKKIHVKILHNNSGNLFKLNDYNLIVKNFDIIHIFGIWSPFINIIIYLARKLNKKIVIAPIGYLEKWSMKQSRLKKKFAWYLYQKKFLEICDYIHVTSEEEFNSIKKLNLKNVKIIFIIHGKIDINYPGINILDENKNNKIMLFFSRIHKKKGLLELIEAWNILRPKDWELNITGPVSDLNYKKIIEKKIINYNLSQKIYFREPIYDNFSKQLAIKKSDIVVLPSKNENFGFSICDAMFSSRMVLCSSEMPWKQINELEIGICAVLDNVQDIILSLKKIFSYNKNQLHEVGKKARNYMLSRYALENVVIYKYIDFYKFLILRS